ncbi:MAG TPA: hypothetical protein DCS64_02175, partial [Algoriphagus sp.]|nr:hypothetical protein [Algoriphagus sp.]
LEIYRQAVLKKAFEGGFTEQWRKSQVNLISQEDLHTSIMKGRSSFLERQVLEWESDFSLWKVNGEKGDRPKKPRPLTVPDPPSPDHEVRKWDLPRSWVWTQLGTICFVTKLAGFEYTDYVKYDTEGDLPVLKAENVGLSGFRKTEFSKVKTGSVKMLTRSQLFGGELLIVFVGAGTGNVAMVPLNQKYFLGPNIGMARPYLKLNSRYIELFFQSAKGKNLMMAAVKAVAQPSLSMATIRQAPIALPSLEEQTQIVQEIESRLSVADKLADTIQFNLLKSESLRQSILKQAFEGKLLTEAELEACRREVDWEPAEKLLERIKSEKTKAKKS